MATGGTMILDSITASADLSANQYGAVAEDGAVPAAGEQIAGIQQDGGVTGEGPLSGHPVNICRLGISKVSVNNSAIVAGSPLTPAGTTGVLKLSAADTDYVCGLAIEANGSAAKIIRALIVPMGRIASS